MTSFNSLSISSPFMISMYIFQFFKAPYFHSSSTLLPFCISAFFLFPLLGFLTSVFAHLFLSVRADCLDKFHAICLGKGSPIKNTQDLLNKLFSFIITGQDKISNI